MTSNGSFFFAFMLDEVVGEVDGFTVILACNKELKNSFTFKYSKVRFAFNKSCSTAD